MYTSAIRPTPRISPLHRSRSDAKPRPTLRAISYFRTTHAATATKSPGLTPLNIFKHELLYCRQPGINIKTLIVLADPLKGFDLNAFRGEERIAWIQMEKDSAKDLAISNQDLVIPFPYVPVSRIGIGDAGFYRAYMRRFIDFEENVSILTGITQRKKLHNRRIVNAYDDYNWIEKHRIKVGRIIDILDRVVDIAVRLGYEGREGKPVGSIFVIGSTNRVLKHCSLKKRDMWRGLSERERNIMDIRNYEDLGETAKMDGAFIVSKSGLVMRSRAILEPPRTRKKIPDGLSGARHLSAFRFSAAMNVPVVVLSESTGNVTVFDHGEIVLQIDGQSRFIAPHVRA